MAEVLLEFPSELRAESGRILPGYLAGRIPAFLSPSELSAGLNAIYGSRAEWVSGFEGEQFSIGEVWYQYRETGQSLDQYLIAAESSRDTVNRMLPGLHARILKTVEALVLPDIVRLRPGWAGPGLVIFPSHERVARIGGGAHFDWDGLETDELASWDLQAFSFVCMLQKPTTGGGLTIWPVEYDRQSTELLDDPPIAGIDSYYINYEPGDLWVFHSLVAHKIEPFDGEVDRICLTFHICQRDGGWDVWF